MTIVTVHDLDTHLAELLDRVVAGEEITIARDNRPIAKIVRFQPLPKREFGALRGIGRIPSQAWEPLPDEELALWEQ